MTINSPIPWVGGKKLLREAIVERFPADYEQRTYVEVFGGGAWVLFYKRPSRAEIYNDFNSNLVNLYRCIREHRGELIDLLTPVLNSREEFERIRELLKKPEAISDVQRAAYYYQSIKYSYGAGVDSYGGRPCSMWASFPLLEQASARLQSVVIENCDFEKLIERFDGENTLLYLDPPYYGTENYYEGSNFGKQDHKRLADILHNVRSKALVSYNACPEVFELYRDEKFDIEQVERLNNMAQRTEPGAMYEEYLISNYDTSEQLRQNMQMTFWNAMENCGKQLSERKYVWKTKWNP